jgi:hypothetical protein
MGGRVVEGTGLENRQARKRLVGSNPTPSATRRSRIGCKEIIMLRTLALVAFAALFLANATFAAGDYGTAEEAKAILDKAVAAVKADKAKALEMFQQT